MKKHAFNPSSVKFVDLNNYAVRKQQCHKDDNPDSNLVMIIKNYMNHDIDSKTFIGLIFNMIAANIHNGVDEIRVNGSSISNIVIDDNINTIKQILEKSIRNNTINVRYINMICIPVDNIFDKDEYRKNTYYANITHILDVIKDSICK